MTKTKDVSAPLSEHAQKQLRAIYSGDNVGIGVVWAVALFVAFGFSCIIGEGWALLYTFLGLVAPTIPLKIFLKRPSRQSARAIYLTNQRDHERSVALQEVLTRFATTPSADLSVIESELPGEWRPFAIEHHVSSTIRGELSGQLHVGWTFSGQARGRTTPDLLDDSSVLFLRDGANTMRVIVPSPRTTREMLADLLERWLEKTPRGYDVGYTHTRGVLAQFRCSDRTLIEPITNPRAIDRLHAACEEPLDQRPPVIVRGNVVQPGVALCTALRVEGREFTFMPSGFFQALSQEVGRLLGTSEVPRLTTAVPA